MSGCNAADQASTYSPDLLRPAVHGADGVFQPPPTLPAPSAPRPPAAAGRLLLPPAPPPRGRPPRPPRPTSPWRPPPPSSAPMPVPRTRPASLPLAPPSSPPLFCKSTAAAGRLGFLSQQDGVFSLAVRQAQLAFLFLYIGFAGLCGSCRARGALDQSIHPSRPRCKRNVLMCCCWFAAGKGSRPGCAGRNKSTMKSRSSDVVRCGN
jgi:hypothetical protein